MLDGATRDGEGHRDLGIAQPVARELNHFVLARRELAAVSPSSGSVRRYEAALPECRPDAARVPLGAEGPVAVHRSHEQSPSCGGILGEERPASVLTGSGRLVGAGQRAPATLGRLVFSSRASHVSLRFCDEAATALDCGVGRGSVSAVEAFAEAADEFRRLR